MAWASRPPASTPLRARKPFLAVPPPAGGSDCLTSTSWAGGRPRGPPAGPCSFPDPGHRPHAPRACHAPSRLSASGAHVRRLSRFQSLGWQVVWEIQRWPGCQLLSQQPGGSSCFHRIFRRRIYEVVNWHWAGVAMSSQNFRIRCAF